MDHFRSDKTLIIYEYGVKFSVSIFYANNKIDSENEPFTTPLLSLYAAVGGVVLGILSVGIFTRGIARSWSSTSHVPEEKQSRQAYQTKSKRRK